MGLFTEQFAMPERVTYELPDTVPGKLKELSRQGGGFVLREVQAQIYMRPSVAKVIAEWLLDKVQQAEQLEKEVREAREAQGDSSTDLQPLIVESEE